MCASGPLCILCGTAADSPGKSRRTFYLRSVCASRTKGKALCVSLPPASPACRVSEKHVFPFAFWLHCYVASYNDTLCISHTSCTWNPLRTFHSSDILSWLFAFSVDPCFLRGKPRKTCIPWITSTFCIWDRYLVGYSFGGISYSAISFLLLSLRSNSLCAARFARLPARI